MVTVRRYNSAREFLDANLAELVLQESQYALKIGLALQFAEGQRKKGPSHFYGMEGADGRPIGQALRTSPERPLILSQMSMEMLDCLLEELRKEGLQLTGVIGPKETSAAFAEKWAAATACSIRLVMGQLVYEARRIRVPSSEGGKLILANDKDFDLAFQWTEAFARECHLPEAKDRELLEETVRRMLPGGLLFFWKSRDGQVVAMAARSRESPSGATVSYVYTPENLRRKGYASCVVGYLSQRILDGGKSFCCLYTDVSNPTSNSIYGKLGYEVMGEGAQYSFSP